MHACSYMAMWSIPTLVLQCLLFFHAVLDCICTLCCLFPYTFSCPYLASMYSSMYMHSHDGEHLALARALVYWASAMSLVRVMALIFWPCYPLLLCVSIMYILEALAFEYEGYTAQTVTPGKARMVSRFSFLISLLLCIFSAVSLLCHI